MAKDRKARTYAIRRNPHSNFQLMQLFQEQKYINFRLIVGHPLTQ
jgi:hypothetical protein